MKKLFTILLAGVCLQAAAQPYKNADIIIRHVNVVPMNKETVLEDQVVCIDEGRISYIGKDHKKDISSQAQIVDGKGQYLMPGLAEMHCHLPDEKSLPRFFDLNLAAGVTVLRSMRGKDWHLKYKNTEAPKLYLSAPIAPYDTTITTALADSLVKSYHEKGFDFLKVIALKDSNSFKELVAAAKKYNMPVCGHMLWNVNYETVLNSGYNSLEHLDWQTELYDKGKDSFEHYLSLAEKNGAYHCPTFDYYQVVFRQIPEEELLKRNGMEYVPDSTKAKWHKSFADALAKRGAAAIEKTQAEYNEKMQKQLKMVKEMSDRGMGLLAGADPEFFAAPGFGLIEELKVFKKAGLSNYQVLETATSNAARYLKADKAWGTIETGKCANCILLAANPLEDINAIVDVKAVFLNKLFYTDKELKAMLN